jgi:hypothetical protein
MKKYITVKRRIDRGKSYAGYYSFAAMTILLLEKFGLNGWWWYVAVIVFGFIGCYIIGYFEDVFGVLKNEQLSYYTNNPVIQEILNEIKKISKDEMVRKNIETKKGDNN